MAAKRKRKKTATKKQRAKTRGKARKPSATKKRRVAPSAKQPKGWVAEYKAKKAARKPPEYFRSRYAYAPELSVMARQGLTQLGYERSLRYWLIKTIPISADIEHLLERIFRDCDAMVSFVGLKVELSTYILDVNIARSGTLGPRGKIIPEWSNEFISIVNPNGLRKLTPRELWISFEEYALQKINNIQRGEILVKQEIVSASKSDPVFIRPARLRIYVHGRA